jgi:hypothetical protein
MTETKNVTSWFNAYKIVCVMQESGGVEKLWCCEERRAQRAGAHNKQARKEVSPHRSAEAAVPQIRKEYFTFEKSGFWRATAGENWELQEYAKHG